MDWSIIETWKKKWIIDCLPQQSDKFIAISLFFQSNKEGLFCAKRRASRAILLKMYA